MINDLTGVWKWWIHQFPKENYHHSVKAVQSLFNGGFWQRIGTAIESNISTKKKRRKNNDDYDAYEKTSQENGGDAFVVESAICAS